MNASRFQNLLLSSPSTVPGYLSRSSTNRQLTVKPSTKNSQVTSHYRALLYWHRARVAIVPLYGALRLNLRNNLQEGQRCGVAEHSSTNSFGPSHGHLPQTVIITTFRFRFRFRFRHMVRVRVRVRSRSKGQVQGQGSKSAGARIASSSRLVV